MGWSNINRFQNMILMLRWRGSISSVHMTGYTTFSVLQSFLLSFTSNAFFRERNLTLGTPTLKSLYSSKINA